MKFYSIFNDVLGPVMRGPSSSHTAGSYRIGRIIRDLFGEQPTSAVFTFDPEGSYARTYKQQGVDLALAAGIMEWDITDSRFPEALAYAVRYSITIEYLVETLTKADHPNTVQITLTGTGGRTMQATAQSIGGGLIRMIEIDRTPVEITGKTYCMLIHAGLGSTIVEQISKLWGIERIEQTETDAGTLIEVHTSHQQEAGVITGIRESAGVRSVSSAEPVFYVKRGDPLFESGQEIISYADENSVSLAAAAAEYEARLLGLSKDEVISEMNARYTIMKQSVNEGMNNKSSRMKLLNPTASLILASESAGRLALGGPHTRAGARAMAAMHVSNSGGIVCAAPTGGSAGVIPGVVLTLEEELALSTEQCAYALFAAGAVGLITAIRATFAAEVAGCQVEIGAAGAMASAAIVEAAGGTAEQALNAAAISLQNSMGSVCDLVQGLCEIPCHTRNATAASGAFVNADLIMGGYRNPVNFDETIDAMFSVGKMMPAELRCTSLGGLAIAPSALKLRQKE